MMPPASGDSLRRHGTPNAMQARGLVPPARRATASYATCMETVTHREMRNRSGEILRRVEAGESVRVSNNGHLAALIVPVGGDALDGLVARGEARPARADAGTLAAIRRVVSPVSSRDLLEDARGRW